MVSYAIYPRLQYITDITNAKNAVVTTLTDHDFTDGEIVSLRVTKDFGMFEANEKEARVLEHGSTTITIELDTTNYTPFVYPTLATKYTPPVVVPSASGIVPGMAVATMNLEDSFDNRRT